MSSNQCSPELGSPDLMKEVSPFGRWVLTRRGESSPHFQIPLDNEDRDPGITKGPAFAGPLGLELLRFPSIALIT